MCPVGCQRPVCPGLGGWGGSSPLANPPHHPHRLALVEGCSSRRVAARGMGGFLLSLTLLGGLSLGGVGVAVAALF